MIRMAKAFRPGAMPCYHLSGLEEFDGSYDEYVLHSQTARFIAY